MRLCFKKKGCVYSLFLYFLKKKIQDFIFSVGKSTFFPISGILYIETQNQYVVVYKTFFQIEKKRGEYYEETKKMYDDFIFNLPVCDSSTGKNTECQSI